MSHASSNQPPPEPTPPAATTPAPPEPTPQSQPSILAPGYVEYTIPILVLVMIVGFEMMAVVKAMPQVAQDLPSHNPATLSGLGISSFLTAQLLGIVLAGVWSDRSGPLPGTFAGQALMAVGSAVCAASPVFAVFFVGRVLTGLGAGLLMVVLYVIVGRVYAEDVRPKLFMYIAGAYILPAMLGPFLAAGLMDLGTWRLVFAVVVVPVAFTVVGLGRLARRTDTSGLDQHPATRDHTEHVRVAWIGLALAVSAGLIQFGLPDLAFRLSPATVIIMIGVIGVAVSAPRLVPRGTWIMRRGLPSVMFARAFLMAAFYGAMPYVTFMLERMHGKHIDYSLLALGLGAVGWAVGSWMQGLPSLMARRHSLIFFGALLLFAGMAVLSVSAWFHWNPWFASLSMLAAGIGMGMGVTSTTVVGLELTPVAEHGPTSSSLQLADVLGSVMGLVVAAAVVSALKANRDLDIVVELTDPHIYGIAFAVLTLTALTCVLAGTRIKPKGGFPTPELSEPGRSPLGS